MKKRFLSIVLTLLMLASLLPAAFADWTVPEGYDEYEYNQFAAFLETMDADQVKNGTKLDDEDEEDETKYDVNDPSTWADGWVFMHFGNTPYHVMNISWRDRGLVGTLDVSGFTQLSGLYLSGNRLTAVNASNCPELGDVEVYDDTVQSLDFSNCESLSNLICNNNQLTSLNVSGCSGIEGSIFCNDNLLTELDVSDCTEMGSLDCHNNLLKNLNVRNCAGLSTLNAQDNALTELDLSDCASLQVLNLAGNRFTSIDTSACPKLHLDTVTAVGPGTVGYWETLAGGSSRVILYAYPDEGAKFLGWYDANDAQLSTEVKWDASSELDSIGTAVTAKFRWDLANGAYLVGTMNDWAPTPADQFTPNPDSEGEYKLETTLTAGDEIKVIQSVGGNWTWYPGGDNYVVDEAHAGNVTIYFRNTYQSAWAEFGGYFYIAPKHSISLKTDGEGTASFAPAAPSTGETVKLTVTPAEETAYDYTEIYRVTGEGENDKELVELGSLEWNDDELSFLMPDYDILIVVYFKGTAVTVTVSFDAGEGTVDPETVQVNAGGSIETLPEPVLEGWKFLGWFTEPAENAFVAGQGTQVTTETTFIEDTTVYAQWRLPGDINGDGSVNNKDVTRLTRWLKTHDVEVVSFNLDVNGDGSVNNKDLTRLVRWVKSHDVVLN